MQIIPVRVRRLHMSSTSPSTVLLPGPTHTPSQTPLIAGSLTGLIVLLVCLVTLFLLHRRRFFAQRVRQQESLSSRHLRAPDKHRSFDDRPAGRHYRVCDSHDLPLAFPVAQPSMTPSLSSSQPHKTPAQPCVRVLPTTCGAVVDDNVEGQGVTGQGLATCDHQTGLANHGRSSNTVDEPRPTTDEVHGNVNETLSVSGGDVHSQTYMPSNHRRPLDPPTGPGNHNTELAPKSRRGDVGREAALRPAVVSSEPRNGMGPESLPLGVGGQGVDAPPAYESAWAVERQIGAG